ncbi:MAG TPA: radical SAM protein [Candidatus Lokiarchaeia archaeon]|nr:radical SAM protein [Candidatus Lokiarchaeia archaeon]
MNTKTFELKCELLFKGFRLQDGAGTTPGAAQEQPSNERSMIDKVARKGGAGPAGGMFVQYQDAFLANVPLQEQMTKNSDLFITEIPTSGVFDVFKEHSPGELEPFHQFSKIPAPSFYDEEYISKERTGIGTPVTFKKIALVHGIDCVATTINQSCKYWRCGMQCDYCAIEESIKDDSTLPRKDPDALVAFTERARAEDRVKHFTLTSGTQDSPDGGALEYIPFVEALKSNFKYPVHVQVAPVKNMEYLDKLYYAEVDTIGIHVETYPEKNRRLHCPGKSEIPLKQFEKNWDYAVGLFGENQVESYLLAGLGETFDEFKQGIEVLLEHEVIPFVVPARPIENTKFDENKLESHEILIQYYLYAAKRMREQGLQPSKTLAGCVRCGACSSISEAIKVVQQYP